jgi:hypothetical protein
MKKRRLLFLVLLLLPCGAFAQQINSAQAPATNQNILNGGKSKYHIYMEDTTEHGLITHFRGMMNNSQTVMDAQVISRKSQWGFFKDDLFPNGRREIYTAITFRVFHWIKGSVRGDEVTFYQAGGKIGDTIETTFPEHVYSLNERAIFFLGNKKPNTYLLDRGRMEIFGAENGRHGELFVGTWTIDPEDYIKVMKQSLTDTTAYAKYMHTLKLSDEAYRLRKLKYGNRLMPADSVDRAARKMKSADRDTTKGGVK